MKEPGSGLSALIPLDTRLGLYLQKREGEGATKRERETRTMDYSFIDFPRAGLSLKYRVMQKRK